MLLSRAEHLAQLGERGVGSRPRLLHLLAGFVGRRGDDLEVVRCGHAGLAHGHVLLLDLGGLDAEVTEDAGGGVDRRGDDLEGVGVLLDRPREPCEVADRLTRPLRDTADVDREVAQELRVLLHSVGDGQDRGGEVLHDLGHPRAQLRQHRLECPLDTVDGRAQLRQGVDALLGEVGELGREFGEVAAYDRRQLSQLPLGGLHDRGPDLLERLAHQLRLAAGRLVQLPDRVLRGVGSLGRRQAKAGQRAAEPDDDRVRRERGDGR